MVWLSPFAPVPVPAEVSDSVPVSAPVPVPVDPADVTPVPVAAATLLEEGEAAAESAASFEPAESATASFEATGAGADTAAVALWRPCLPPPLRGAGMAVTREAKAIRKATENFILSCLACWTICRRGKNEERELTGSFIE